MKGIFGSLLALGFALAGGGTALAQGKNILEIRIQSAGNVAGGSALLGIVAGPGLTYEKEGKNLSLNLSAGVGTFLSPTTAIGADLGFTYLDVNDQTLKIFNFVPFVKFVTGLPERKSGFFAEPGAGIGVVALEHLDSQTLLQAGVWAGGHFFLGESSTAFLIGPFVTYLRNLSSGSGADDWLIGLRFGLSVYLM